MKNLLLVFLLCLSFTAGINKIFAWDPEAAKFFPLAVGNQWSYHYVTKAPSGSLNCYPVDQYNFIISISGDTVINGRRYYKFSNGDKLRIDSTSMNVYKLLGVNECKVDSLLARKNSQYGSCELAGIVSDTNMTMFAGENRRSFNITGIGYFRRLMYGIGVYYYGGCELGYGHDKQLNGCIINGIQYGNMLGVTQTGNEIPSQFSLSQNYPNPFNPTTNIKFDIPRTGFVKITVFDILGKEIQTLVNEQLSSGSYNYDFDASHLPSGVYYYKLESNEFMQTKKMVLIK